MNTIQARVIIEEVLKPARVNVDDATVTQWLVGGLAEIPFVDAFEIVREIKYQVDRKLRPQDFTRAYSERRGLTAPKPVRDQLTPHDDAMERLAAARRILEEAS